MQQPSLWRVAYDVCHSAVFHSVIYNYVAQMVIHCPLITLPKLQFVLNRYSKTYNMQYMLVRYLLFYIHYAVLTNNNI